jgi:hypothetical protein
MSVIDNTKHNSNKKHKRGSIQSKYPIHKQHKYDKVQLSWEKSKPEQDW